MSARWPRLAAKHGHDDARYLHQKERAEKHARWHRTAERVVEIMLEAGIVSSSGWYPPFRILARVLKEGRAPEVTGRTYTWTPFELEEDIYWIMIRRLPDSERKSRPELEGVKLRQDIGASGVADFSAWVESLKEEVCRDG